MDLGAGQLLLLAGVGVLAGVINGVVGSGTLLTFPVLVALGIPLYFALSRRAGEPAATS